MSLSGDKGVAQFKKSVKMGHPIGKSKLRYSPQFMFRPSIRSADGPVNVDSIAVSVFVNIG